MWRAMRGSAFERYPRSPQPRLPLLLVDKRNILLRDFAKSRGMRYTGAEFMKLGYDARITIGTEFALNAGLLLWGRKVPILRQIVAKKPTSYR